MAEASGEGSFRMPNEMISFAAFSTGISSFRSRSGETYTNCPIAGFGDAGTRTATASGTVLKISGSGVRLVTNPITQSPLPGYSTSTASLNEDASLEAKVSITYFSTA